MTLARILLLVVAGGGLWVAGVAAVERARIAANETAAVAALRTINQAQAAYAAECGAGRYARSLQDLATPPPGRDEPYLPGALGRWPTPLVDGYWFTIRAAAEPEGGTEDCNGLPTQGAYYSVAVPSRPGMTGTRSFATSQDGGIWQMHGPGPPPEPFGPPAARIE